MSNERFEKLSEELKAQAIQCKTPEELQELAKSHGEELTVDDLDAAAGGAWGCNNNADDDKTC